MDNKNVTLAEEEALKLAAAEKKFSAESLTGELLPLLESYFIGSFSREGDKINLNFLNGQSFILSIREVK